MVDADNRSSDNLLSRAADVQKRHYTQRQKDHTLPKSTLVDLVFDPFEKTGDFDPNAETKTREEIKAEIHAEKRQKFREARAAYKSAKERLPLLPTREQASEVDSLERAYKDARYPYLTAEWDNGNIPESLVQYSADDQNKTVAKDIGTLLWLDSYVETTKRKHDTKLKFDIDFQRHERMSKHPKTTPDELKLLEDNLSRSRNTYESTKRDLQRIADKIADVESYLDKKYKETDIDIYDEYETQIVTAQDEDSGRTALVDTNVPEITLSYSMDTEKNLSIPPNSELALGNTDDTAKNARIQGDAESGTPTLESLLTNPIARSRPDESAMPKDKNEFEQDLLEMMHYEGLLDKYKEGYDKREISSERFYELKRKTNKEYEELFEIFLSRFDNPDDALAYVDRFKSSSKDHSKDWLKTLGKIVSKVTLVTIDSKVVSSVNIHRHFQ